MRLLCGADLLLSMTNPQVWTPEDVREILTRYGLLVVNRFDIDLKAVIAGNPVMAECAERIELVADFAGSAVSSTRAREAIRAGQLPEELLHRPVCDYIRENLLYSPE